MRKIIIAALCGALASGPANAVQGFGAVAVIPCGRFLLNWSQYVESGERSSELQQQWIWLQGYFSGANVFGADAKKIPDIEMYLSAIATYCRAKPAKTLAEAAGDVFLVMPDEDQ